MTSPLPAECPPRPLLALGFALLTILVGCSCPPAPEMKRLPGFDLSTPEAALAYFRAAATRNDPWQEYLLFSEALKEEVERKEGHVFSIANYDYAREQVLDELRKRIGPLSGVEIGDAKEVGPGLAEVPIGSGEHRATILMILQVEYSIRIIEGDEPLEGILPPNHPAIRRTDRGITLDLPALLPVDVPPEDVYRVEYERAWKIRGLKDSDLASELGGLLPKSAPPPKPKS